MKTIIQRNLQHLHVSSTTNTFVPSPLVCSNNSYLDLVEDVRNPSRTGRGYTHNTALILLDVICEILEELSDLEAGVISQSQMTRERTLTRASFPGAGVIIATTWISDISYRFRITPGLQIPFLLLPSNSIARLYQGKQETKLLLHRERAI